MATYLIRSTATPDTWASLVAEPENRREASEAAAGLYGGKILGYWYAFGEYDVYGIFEAPDDTTAAMLKAAISASGSYSRVEVVTLLSVEQMLEALTRAQSFPYRRPGEPDADVGESPTARTGKDL